MLPIDSSLSINIVLGHTDMRKGAQKLSLLISDIELSSEKTKLFVFRGRRSDRIKILWWDGQGYCLYSKCLERGKFIWPSSSEGFSIGITKGQLSMLIEGIDWRMPRWSSAPEYVG